jgi:hypothetical protein
MSRRDVDDEPANFTLSHCVELSGHHLNVPIHMEVSLRIELIEAALDEGTKVIP